MNALISSWQNFARLYAIIAQASSTLAGRIVAACRSISKSVLKHLGMRDIADSMDGRLQQYWEGWQETRALRRLDLLFFKPIELVNSGWLVYIVLAQTIGTYNNCRCKASDWAGGGG